MSLTTREIAVVRALAADISANNDEINARVAALIESPPGLEPEQLGFYPRGDEDEYERVIRATVHALSPEHNFGAPNQIYGFEDKYINEALSVMADLGLLPVDKLKPESLHLIQGLLDLESLSEDAGGMDKLEAQLLPRLAALFSDIESAYEADEKALLSFDLGAGDTWHVFVLPAGIAARWRNTKLHEMPDGDPIAVSDADWQTFMDHFSYATRLLENAVLPLELRTKPLRTPVLE